MGVTIFISNANCIRNKNSWTHVAYHLLELIVHKRNPFTPKFLPIEELDILIFSKYS